MYATSAFIYTQRQIVVLLSGNSVRRYMPIYAKPLTLHKGVDNQIQFQFLNQDQKPVDLTGKSITCRIINYSGTEVLLTKTLTLQYALTGIAALELNAADIENIDAQRAHYSIEIPVGEFDYPVYVDQNAGARGDMNIDNSILPAFVPSASITIPTGQPFPNLNSSANANSTANTFYSSTINTEDNPILSIQAEYSGYYGNVTIQGSTIVDADWYPITTLVYSNVSNTLGYTVTGFHPYIRMEFVANVGDVSNILAR